MSAEELNFWALNEWWWTWAEVSEEAKKKVAEDGKKAQQTHKQVKQMQVKNAKFALFLSQILQRYYNNEIIINLLYELLHNIEENEKIIEVIFSPFVLWEWFASISDYVDYLKLQKNKGNHNLIWEIIEFEKLGWKSLWSNLKKGRTEISYQDFKKEVLDSLK